MTVKFPNGQAVSGIHGAQENSVRGWPHHLTGLGGNVDIRLNHSQGVPSLDHNSVSIDEPLRLGRFIGVWLRHPSFFHPVISKYWNYFMQDKIQEFSGLVDNEISKMTKVTGSVKRDDHYMGSYKENNSTFTLKVPEVKSSPVRKMMAYYTSAVSDKVTGTAHFHGNADLRYSKVNYGGDFLYILLGPTMRPDDIEFACAYFNSFPTKDYLSHVNSGAIGEPGEADRTFEIEFSGTYVNNDEINKLAQIMTEAYGFYKDTHEDVLLPSYIYKNFFGGDIHTLTKEYGANLDQKLENMKAFSAAAQIAQTMRPDIIDKSETSITPKTNEDNISNPIDTASVYEGPVPA